MTVAPNYNKCLRYQSQRRNDAPKRYIQWRWEHHSISSSRIFGRNPTNSLQVMTKAKRDIDVDAMLRAACVEMG